MGAIQFIEKVRAKSLSEAYKKAVADAEDEHGHEEGYSGAINCADSPSDVTRYYENSKQPLSKYIDAMIENAGKRDCFGICLEQPKSNTNKIKTQVENIPTKGTQKWILQYVVYDYEDRIKSFPTKGLAVSCARAYTEKTLKRTSIVMEKTLEKGSSTVARITYKRSDNEKEGLYVLFGLAPD